MNLLDKFNSLGIDVIIEDGICVTNGSCGFARVHGLPSLFGLRMMVVGGVSKYKM